MSTHTKQILSFLWQSARPYKWHLLLVLQAPLVGSCFVPVTQYATKLTIDILVAHASTSFIFSDLTIPIILFIVGQVLTEVSWSISNLVSYKSIVFIKANITTRVYSYVIDHSYKFFQENYSGTISAKVNNIQVVANKIFDNIKYNLINRLTILISTAILFYIVSKEFFIIVLVFYAIFFPVVYHLSKVLHSLSQDYTSNIQKTSGLIVDSISNIFSVFMFANKFREKTSIQQGLTGVSSSEQRMLRYEFYLHLFIGITYLAVSIGVLWLLIYFRQLGKITIGDFALVLGALFHMLEVAFSLVTDITNIVKDWGELRESFNIFDKKHEIRDIAAAKDIVITKPAIVFNNISFNYDQNIAVFNKFSLNIKAGEKVGLVGLSGAGKSTLVSLLLRYFKVNNGEILIDKQNVNNITENSLRKNITVVPQDTVLFHRSIKENIMYGKLDATEAELILASKQAYLYDFIKDLPKGFDTIAGERGLKLSGGQRQRIAIARAFLKDAPILILDEATSNLDSKTEQDIQISIAELIEDKTVIAIAHRLSTLKNMDRIIVLDKGMIIEEGSHAELIQRSNGRYKELFELQGNIK
ncbi:MAG: hypothetical protein COB50_03245 [Thiotrichales bacterium]|nr:MAG: hypothetical protein COB50_03245 [Thiotrichales bacterium]